MNSFWVTRFVFLRFLGVIYGVAYLILIHQIIPLVGSQGLLPAREFLDSIRLSEGIQGGLTWPGWTEFLHLLGRVPTLFWLGCSDSALLTLAWTGLILSGVVISGFANSILLFVLWIIYLSFVHVGQVFYGFGWEILLLETGFLAIFLAPGFSLRPFPQNSPPPVSVIWLLRWVLFRMMFGAGLIKIRGDSCWWDLTCMEYHYQTQPLPNPLSIYFHRLPPLIHHASVLFTHFVECIAPWGILGPRRLRTFIGCLMVLFQGLLISSGNLSWLNYITLTLALVCFDDSFFLNLARVFPRVRFHFPKEVKQGYPRRVLLGGLVLLISLLSVRPALNLISSTQLMNASYDPFFLVNTYGAFGSVTRQRLEIILEGTSDTVLTKDSQWEAYEFKCKPGDPNRVPCIVSPYHYKIDWQMWFAAMSDYRGHPWLIHLIRKLLEADAGAISLLARSPFGVNRPQFLRAELYEYQFSDEALKGSPIWNRKRVGVYLPPLSLQSLRSGSGPVQP